MMQIVIDAGNGLDVLLDELVAKLGSLEELHFNWANAFVHAAQRNARAKGSGGGFWEETVADSVELAEYSADGAVVTIGSEGAHKQHGGTVRAKNAKALTIPLHAIARGKRVRELELDGIDVFRPKGTNILAMTGPNGAMVPLYALCRSVTHRAEPWLPTEQEIVAMGIGELNFLLGGV